MKVWPPAGTRYDCWCGAVAVVPFRRPTGPAGKQEPYAECPSRHRSKLETRDVPEPDADPTGPSLFVIIRAGTTLEDAKRQLIAAALERSHQNVAAAAKELGISAPGLYGWIRQRRERSEASAEA